MQLKNARIKMKIHEENILIAMQKKQNKITAEEIPVVHFILGCQAGVPSGKNNGYCMASYIAN